jgi:hypothetical protein
MTLVAGEQVLNEGRDAAVFLAVEFGVFEEGEVPRSADSFYLAEDAEGVTVEFVEFFAGSFWKHGADYINFRKPHNGTSVLGEFRRSLIASRRRTSVLAACRSSACTKRRLEFST